MIISRPTPPAAGPHARAPSTTARRRVPDTTIASTIDLKLDDFSDILFVFELCDTVVLPYMLDERLNISTHGDTISVSRAQHAGVLPIGAGKMTLDHESVGHLEAALVAVFVLANLPRFAGREMQCAFAVRAVWDGV